MKLDPAALLLALRPHQWVKNVFVFAALIFARGAGGGLFQGGLDDVRRTLWAFAAFCLGASAIYLLNDVLDRESDRNHPSKSRRPIASGRVGVTQALALSAGCAVGALWCGFRAQGDPVAVWPVVAGYMALNFAYSVKLKHVVLVDAFCIAAGFLLRVIAGALAVPAAISHWLLLCTMFLALFLALCKRKAEMDLLGEGRGEHRAILREYNGAFLDQMTTVLAACTIVTYTMYTVADETVEKFQGDRLVWTVPFVVFGLGRYLFLVHTQKGGGSPTRVLLGGDLLFALNTLGWIATVAWVASRAA
ncbi:MAG: decaprenyl-phosphate phosphoribosyltransferase [Planctomycetes bacterium]|nr:decaprenyl-phosphate phosphoribosyltransferase [Planctomycetota bacterium]